MYCPVPQGRGAGWDSYAALLCRNLCTLFLFHPTSAAIFLKDMLCSSWSITTLSSMSLCSSSVTIFRILLSVAMSSLTNFMKLLVFSMLHTITLSAEYLCSALLTSTCLRYTLPLPSSEFLPMANMASVKFPSILLPARSSSVSPRSLSL